MKTLGIAATGLIAATALAGCGGGDEPKTAPPATVTATGSATPKPTPVEATCRAAIRADYEAGFDAKGGTAYPPATRQSVCAGFDRPTLQRLMDEAIADIMNGTAGPG
jgi:hypothetical protein